MTQSNLLLQNQYQQQFTEQSYSDASYLLPDTLPEPSKRFLNCLLILPLIFFIVCLCLFIIMICTQHSSTVVVDSAISTTQQFGENILAKPWLEVESTIEECKDGKTELVYDIFPGIAMGYINEITKNTEYEEIETKKKCDNLKMCQTEAGISSVSLSRAVNKINRLCVKKMDLDQFALKDSLDQCPQNLPKFCQSSQICVASKCPLTGLSLKPLSISNIAFPIAGQILNQKIAKASDVIGIRGGFSLPCKNPEIQQKLPSKTTYPLYGNDYTGCDEYGSYEQEKTPIIVEKMSFKDLLMINGLDKITSKSPYFYDYIGKQEANSYNFYEIHRPNIKTHIKCNFGNDGFAKLRVVRQYLYEVNGMMYIYVVTGLLIASMGFFFWIIFIFTIFSTHTKEKRKKNTQILKMVHLSALMLAVLLIIIYLHYELTIQDELTEMSQVQIAFNQAKSIQCYNNAIGWNDAFLEVVDFVNSSLNIYHPFIFVLMVTGFSYLVLLFAILAVMYVKNVFPFMPPYLHYSNYSS